ncbi:hypothetical protein, partial [Mycobacterium simiae]|uniref:hypothetical protein n=1 Tax=Mycobacterium simiae TaxID=1784 RepID=UPI001CB6EFD7
RRLGPPVMAGSVGPLVAAVTAELVVLAGLPVLRWGRPAVPAGSVELVGRPGPVVMVGPAATSAVRAVVAVLVGRPRLVVTAGPAGLAVIRLTLRG